MHKSLPYFGNFHKPYCISLENKWGMETLISWRLTGYFSVYRPGVHVLFVGAGSCSPGHVGLKVHLSAKLDKGLYSGIVLWILSLLLLFLTVHSDAHTLLFQSYVFSSREDLKSYASQLLAIVTCCQPETDVLETFTDFLSKMSDKVSQLFLKNLMNQHACHVLPLIMNNPWT